MSTHATVLDCGCYIAAGGGRTWCPSCTDGQRSRSDRLHQAAPDMLFALKDVLDENGWADPYNETGLSKEERHEGMLSLVRAAIAKATGETA